MGMNTAVVDPTATALKMNLVMSRCIKKYCNFPPSSSILIFYVFAAASTGACVYQNKPLLFMYDCSKFKVSHPVGPRFEMKLREQDYSKRIGK